MPLLSHPPLLGEILRVVARRHRIPATPAASTQITSPTAAIAIVIEQARAAKVRGDVPDATLKRRFLEALTGIIHEAMHAEHGDPAFRAMVLRHRAPSVREFASLSAQADRDRRTIRTSVDAIAHPAKLQRLCPGRQREALAQLYASASSASWPQLADTARRLLLMPEASNESPLGRALKRLLDGPALGHLQRLEVLSSDELVQQYQMLWERHGPRSGSSAAAAQGSAAQQRGVAVEALAAHALDALARRLNEAEGRLAPYRVVTSMRAPASIPGSTERAKSEWDVVLLRQAMTIESSPVWDVCLLVEVKASVDGATTDFPRLLRGLRLLAHARKDATYPAATRQGEVKLRGASLSTLPVNEDGLAATVLYCCNAPADAAPRLLSAASRMQLLSSQASLTFASKLADNQPADARDLEPVWQQLLASPRWNPVLHQYATLCRVRDLMVHIDDLSAAIAGTTDDA